MEYRVHHGELLSVLDDAIARADALTFKNAHRLLSVLLELAALDSCPRARDSYRAIGCTIRFHMDNGLRFGPTADQRLRQPRDGLRIPKRPQA